MRALRVRLRSALAVAFTAAVLAKASFGAGLLNGSACEHQLLGTDASIAQSKQLAAEWNAKRGVDVREHLTNPWMNPKVERNHPEVWEMRGIPKFARQIDTNGKVFRHWATLATIAAIKSSKVLMSAYLPYVEMAPGIYKKNWNDVTGAFLTVPGSSHQSVGVDAHGESYAYVDVRVAPEIPVFELEPNHIYVVPLKGNVRGWVRELYLKYKQTGEVSSSYRDMVARIDARGGLEPFVAAVPIEIVGEGR